MKEGWKYERLGNVATIIGGSTPKTTDPSNWGGNNYWVTPAELDGSKYCNKTKRQITDKAAKGMQLLPIGTVLLSSRAPIGKVSITTVPMYCNQGFKNIVCHKELYNEYVYWYIRYSVPELEKLGVGATFKEISKSRLSSFPIKYPSLSEQERIVAFLDAEFEKIDQLKANAAAQLQAAKDLFQAALKEMLTPKEGWKKKTLGEIGSFFRGGNFTKADFVDTGIPCVHYGQIHMHFGVATDKPLTYLPINFPKIKYAKTGDLLIAITSEDDEGSCKCTAWLSKEDVAIGGHMAVFRHNLDPVFISYFFMSPSFQREKLEYTHGFKVVEIKPSDIAKIHISYPCIAEQKDIVCKLDDIQAKLGKLRANYNQTLTLCNDLKQALLKSIFA